MPTQKRNNMCIGSGTRTQKAGGKKSKFVNTMLSSDDHVKKIIKAIGFNLQKIQHSEISTHKTEDSSNKKPDIVSKKVNESYTKDSRILYNIVKAYLISLLKYCYRKLSSDDYNKFKNNTSQVATLFKNYIDNVLLWGIKTDSSSTTGTVLFNIKSGCNNTYSSGYNKERSEAAENLLLQTDISGITTAFNNLLAIEKEIMSHRPKPGESLYNNSNNNIYKKQHSKLSTIEKHKSIIKCNYFIVPENNETNKLQNSVVTINKFDRDCAEDPVLTGSVFHIIKRAGYKNINTNLQLNDFHIIQSKMREASCYAKNYESSLDMSSDKRKERIKQLALHKESFKKLLELFKDSKLIKNNGLGLLYFIRRGLALSVQSNSI